MEKGSQEGTSQGCLLQLSLAIALIDPHGAVQGSQPRWTKTVVVVEDGHLTAAAAGPRRKQVVQWRPFERSKWVEENQKLLRKRRVSEGMSPA